MYIKCTEKELFVFSKIALAAGELNMPCYIIGGFVRDKILGRKTKDADIVCVGDGIALAYNTAAQFAPQPLVAYFKFIILKAEILRWNREVWKTTRTGATLQ